MTNKPVYNSAEFFGAHFDTWTIRVKPLFIHSRSMNENEAYAFCKEWLTAWTGNDPQGLIHFYSKDAFYSDPAKRNGLKGHGEILPYFTKLLERNPDWKWHAKEVFPTKDGFILKWSVEIPIDKKIITEEGMDIVEFHQNKIKRNEVYFDRSTMLAEILGN